MSHTRENMSEEQRGGAYLLFDLHSGTETIKIKEIQDLNYDYTLKIPHKGVYSQPFEQNICITRICSLVRINLAQIYYEYYGCSFEHQ